MTTLVSRTPAYEVPKRSAFSWLGWVVLALILAWSWDGAEMNPAMLWRDADNMRVFLADFFPPDFRHWRLYMSEMLITVQIAVWGTALAVVFSIPLGILSSENLTPWWICQPVRRVMDAFRSINEMVVAMLFVVAVGLGPFAGVRSEERRVGKEGRRSGLGGDSGG